MKCLIPPVARSVKRRLKRQLKKTRDADFRTRCLIVLNLLAGESPTRVAKTLAVSRSSVYRVAERFRESGEAGLIDRREENGDRKLSEDYLALLYDLVASSPQQHGWPRPTWTRELLVKTLEKITGVTVHVATLSRALQQIGARRGRPKPTVNCPWSKRSKNRRLRAIEQLLAELPAEEVAVYADEVDVHLNPRIGLDWMVCGQQKQVLTPGQNQKRYLAGALDVRSGELIWVEAEKKNTLLFIHLLWELVQHYPQARQIHVILDNYSIHRTKQVERSLASEAGQRLRLHFLPPYCPDDNRIERTWQDLHANVTRNHTCTDMAELMKRVRQYLRSRNRKAFNNQQTLAA